MKANRPRNSFDFVKGEQRKRRLNETSISPMRSPQLLAAAAVLALMLALAGVAAAGGTQAERDAECKTVNDWLADNNFPSRINCLSLALDAEQRCDHINEFFLASNVPAWFDCITRKVSGAEYTDYDCADGYDDDGDGLVDGRDPGCEPPVTKIRKAKVRSRNSRAVFAFDGTGGPGTLQFECRLDRRKWKPCESKKRYRHLGGGKHVFKVRAIDQLDRFDASPAKRKFELGAR
jgi:hypothetical protein